MYTPSKPTASSPHSLLTKDDATVFCISLFPLMSPYTTRVFAPSTNWHDSVTPCNLFFFLLVLTSRSMSPARPVFHPYPCSSFNDNIFVMAAFVFLGPGAWNCQDAFPAHGLRGAAAAWQSGLTSQAAKLFDTVLFN